MFHLSTQFHENQTVSLVALILLADRQTNSAELKVSTFHTGMNYCVLSLTSHLTLASLYPLSQIPAAVRQEVQQRGPCALHQTTVRTGHHSQARDQHDAGFRPPPHQLAEVSEAFLYPLLVKRFVFVLFFV